MIVSLYKFFKSIINNLNGLVVIALARKSDGQSSSPTRILKKILVCLGLAYSSLIHVFINPETPPPFPAVACRNLKSKKQKVGSTIR